ncbi:hypothetical protein OKJ48_11110 [Streptomyces kunmingensis]|uniref:Uncharacterized protein n=1 Tax=Streptomyces kunmingensis TaxID=68225 RepID=A0ABU6C7V2_9ACTN|nr:hypothetical protein [Streptomyces kunmingensis]MEB3960787.1 hypothetical protein [Streptomyces kunmingensis]
MPNLPLRRHTLRPTVLTLALAAGLCLASPGVAAASESPTATEEPAPAASAPVSPGGPEWGQEKVDFSGGRIVYTNTASGFDDAGVAYFERTIVTVGGPGGPTYSVTRSHS